MVGITGNIRTKSRHSWSNVFLMHTYTHNYQVLQSGKKDVFCALHILCVWLSYSIHCHSFKVFVSNPSGESMYLTEHTAFSMLVPLMWFFPSLFPFLSVPSLLSFFFCFLLFVTILGICRKDHPLEHCLGNEKM